jgi:hypothetical protein
MTDTNELIRLTETPAELRKMGCRLSYGQVWRMVSSGELASVREGGKVFVPRKALTGYAQQAGL